MKRANICIIGAGRLGRAAISQLAESGHNVIVIDKKAENLKFIREFATIEPIIIDASDINAMRNEVGLEDIDTIIVATSDNIEIIATLLELQAEINLFNNLKIAARAVNKRHARVLKQIGVDWIISPEEEAGIKMALLTVDKNFLNYADSLKEIANGVFAGSVNVKSPHYINKSIRNANLRQFNVNVVLIKRNKETFLPAAETIIQLNDEITIIGKIGDVATVLQKLESIKK
ncbi:potassium channel family protein [Mesomycoplasma hyopneumoniae]|uniref:potassium channel family protein n=1 Tax=Mesomycoplasma hyopneumoniae TaxID=2099 RepID=UPI00136D11C8|nr:TrkA family potassium uptake protein [Mesomycoplasma hyopneumoniae]MXR33565.1 TrkA family potassium uptake protein [Mesomycoplasma hyopneumoniae]